MEFSPPKAAKIPRISLLPSKPRYIRRVLSVTQHGFLDPFTSKYIKCESRSMVCPASIRFSGGSIAHFEGGQEKER